MAIDGMVGFETNDFSECSAHGTTGGSSTATVVASLHGSGSKAFRSAPDTSSGSAAWAQIALPSATTRGVSFYVNGTPPASSTADLFGLYQGSSSVASVSIASSKLALYNASGTLVATGTTTISSGTNYRVSLFVNTGTGAYNLSINGTTELSGTSLGAFGATAPTFFYCGKGGGHGANAANTVSYTFVFDDVVFDNAATPADGNVILLQPAATGHYTAGTDTGAGSPSDVTWPSDGDTSYWSDGTNGDARTFTLTPTSLIGAGTVNAAMVGALARFSSGGDNTPKLRCRSGTADSDSAGGGVISTTYTYLTKVYATDPSTSAAWTQSGLNAAEAGLVNQGNGIGGALRCTAVGLMVHFVPVPVSNQTGSITLFINGGTATGQIPLYVGNLVNHIDMLVGWETNDFSECSASGVSGAGSTATVVASKGGRGSYAFRSRPDTTDGSAAYAKVHLPSASTTRGGRCYLYANALPTGWADLFGLYGGGTPVLTVSLNGTLRLWGGGFVLLGTGTTPIVPGTNYFLTIFVNTNTGGYNLSVNGVTELSGTSGSLNTSPPTDAYFGKGGGPSGPDADNALSYDVVFDDAAFDTELAPPPGQIILMQPAGTGHYTAGTDTGAGSPSDVLFPSDADTSYWSDSTNGDARTFTLAPTSLVGDGLVNCAMVGALARFNLSSGPKPTLRCRSGGVDSDVTPGGTLSTGYTYLPQVYAVEPSTQGRWTQSSLNAAEVGLVNRTSSPALRVTAVGLMVDFQINPVSASVTLYLDSSQTQTNDIPLFVWGKTSRDGSTPLFIDGGFNVLAGSIPLFVAGSAAFGDIPLFIFGVSPTTLTASMPLWVQTDLPHVLAAPLFVEGASAPSWVQSATLFIAGTGRSAGMNLFLLGNYFAPATSNMNLVVRGAANELERAVTLYLANTQKGVTRSLPLFLQVAGRLVGGQAISAGMPLFLKRPTEGGIPLFMRGPGTPGSAGLPLFVLPGVPQAGQLQLVIPHTLGDPHGLVKLYTHGTVVTFVPG